MEVSSPGKTRDEMIALSTIKADYVVVVVVAHDVVWMRSLLRSLEVVPYADDQLTFQSDNMLAKDYCKFFGRTKHIEINYFIRSKKDEVQLSYILTRLMVIDPLSKLLTFNLFKTNVM